MNKRELIEQVMIKLIKNPTHALEGKGNALIFSKSFL